MNDLNFLLYILLKVASDATIICVEIFSLGNNMLKNYLQSN